MKNLFSQPMFQVWRRPIPAGLWSGLIALVGMLATVIAFPHGIFPVGNPYGILALVLLVSLFSGFAMVYHLTIGLFIGGDHLLVVSLTALLWVGIGAALARYSKSGRAALTWWIAIYVICVILTFLTLFISFL